MRLFIACPIPEEIKQNIRKVLDTLKESNADIRWVKPENMHITLKFLGEVEEERVPRIIERVPRALEGIGPFSTEARGVGIFPNTRNARVLWIGLENEETCVRLRSAP